MMEFKSLNFNLEEEMMKAHERDYEKLARTVLTAKGKDPDAIEMICGEAMPAWQAQGIDEDSDCVVAAHDTLDAFRRGRLSWREPGKMKEVDGGLHWPRCQSMKWEPRCELTVVDCGDFRLCYQV